MNDPKQVGLPVWQLFELIDGTFCAGCDEVDCNKNSGGCGHYIDERLGMPIDPPGARAIGALVLESLLSHYPSLRMHLSRETRFVLDPIYCNTDCNGNSRHVQ